MSDEPKVSRPQYIRGMGTSSKVAPSGDTAEGKPQPRPDGQKVCAKCGYFVENEWKLCPQCGHELPQ